MNEVSRLLLLTHVAATIFMAGVIWFVQVVHYPLFANVGDAEFPAYERRHTDSTTWVVAPAMIVEASTALLLFRFRPAGISTLPLSIGLALALVVWLSTAYLQIPCHESLSAGFDPTVQRRLVATNWIRTAAWSLRGLLVLWLTWTSCMKSKGCGSASEGTP